jgi:hypothetical protein
MSSSVSNRQISLDASEPTSVSLQFDLNQPLAAEAMQENADQLMMALFADVDQLLEQGGTLPVVEPVAPEPPLSPLILPLETILPPRVAPRDLIPSLPDLTEPAESFETSNEPAPTPAVAEPKPRWSPLWLAVLYSSMLVSAGILALMFREPLTQTATALLNRSTDSAPPVASSSPETAAPQDTDFLKYIQRSLERLAQKAELPPMPSVAVNPSPSPSPATSPTVVERVYVPVYPTTPSSVAPSAAPSTVNPGAITNPGATTNRSAANRPAPAAAAAASPSPAAAIPNIAAATHTLVGVLDLGDRSAALFEVNGTPQRIQIGEPIGTSGWTLVSISNQEAIVRRNGEVRSIYVGQKF